MFFELIVSLLFSTGMAMGAVYLSQLFFSPSQTTPTVIRIFLGLLPLLILQAFATALDWQGVKEEYFINFFIIMKFSYLLLGIYFIYQILTRNSFSAFYTKNKRSILFVSLVLLLFIPSIFLRTNFHPSWDSDTIVFWLPKLLAMQEEGYLNLSNDVGHYHYYSHFLSILSFLLPTSASSLVVVVSTRIILSFFLAISLAEITKSFPCHLQWFFSLVLISGFPLKWINLYQDAWVAFACLWVLQSVLEKQSLLSFFYSLGFLAGLKNEGNLFAVILFVFSIPYLLPELRLSPMRFLSTKVLLIILAFAPILIWKLHLSIHSLHILEIQTLTTKEFFSRASLILSYLIKGIGRAYQSWLLDGTIALILFSLFSTKTFRNYTFLGLWLASLLLFLAPIGVLLFTSLDFPWLVSTTFSRITASGSLAFVYLCFSWLSRSTKHAVA